MHSKNIFWFFSNQRINLFTSDTCYLKWYLIWKWKSLSRVQLFVAPWLYSPRNSPGQNTGVGSHLLLQRDQPNPGIKPRSPTLQADSLPSELQGRTRRNPWTPLQFSAWTIPSPMRFESLPGLFFLGYYPSALGYHTELLICYFIVVNAPLHQVSLV